MKKVIFVNATACTSGGVLSILNQFTENISKYDKENIYYIFSTVKKSVNDKNINFITDIKGKKILDRIIWDLIGMKQWAKQNKINPHLIISLQNTGVRFEKVKQIVYLHQPLPYAKESKWSLFKEDEAKLWIYKNIYKWWIDFTVKRHANIIVQTEWMKEALINRGYSNDKILVSKPDIGIVEIDKINPIKYNKKFLFYPAADYKYKNHMIIINAVKEIVEDSNSQVSKFKVIFTLNKQSNIYKEVVKLKLNNYFEFVGELPYEKVLSYYKGCQAVLFPSYIETFGLPLIEGSSFGKKILVADCRYSKEVLNNYLLAEYLRYDDVRAWSKGIKDIMKEYEEQAVILKSGNGWDGVFDLINKTVQI